MKKLIIASFVFALVFASQSASAAALWNGATNDCPGISIANQTNNTGIVVPCWPLKTVSANDGNSVNIRFYYHNTSTQNATNVKMVLTAPTSASSSHTFTGQITSDQGSLSLGSVTANTPAGSRLVFSSAHWLPNQKQTETAIPFGQTSTGSEVLTGGLNIGTIAPTWEAQGSVVVVFAVVGTVTPPPTGPTGDLIPSKTSCFISAGQNSCEINFSWNTTNPVGTSTVTKDGGPVIATGNSGSKAFTIPYNNATFRLQNNGLELDVEAVTSSCTAGTSWNGSVCNTDINPKDSCSISSFTVGGGLSSTVTLGNSVELAWTTTGCNYVDIPGVGSSLNANDHKTIFPSVSGTYRLSAYGTGGNPSPRTVSVTVNPVSNPTYSCSITNFTANGSQFTTIKDNNSVEIYWNTSNCTTVNIPGVGTNLESSGHYTAYPTRSIRYTMTASGNQGSTQSRYVEITVNRDVNPTYSCSISNFTIDNSQIRLGESVRLNWDTENCTNVTISNVGIVYPSGNRVLYPAYSTNYVLTAYGANSGTQVRTVQVTVNPYIQPIPQPVPQPIPVYNKCAVTTVATNVNQTGAQLNGILTGSTGANTYFEYGPTVNLGYRTNSRYVNSNTNFSDVISGLSSNTIYFFRMNSDCLNGISQGSIEVFRTLVIQNPINPNPKPIVIQGTTVIGTASPIMLNISNRYELIGNGELIDYIVTYKNIGKTILLQPMVQVVLPTNVTLVNASRGTYSVDTHTLSAPIEDLNPNQEGVIYLQGRVDSIPLNNSQIATTAILIYTGTNGSQENAMAYVLNRPKIMAVVDTVNSSLGGSALFGGVFSIGLIGWLIIILIILLIVLIVRSTYRRNPNNITFNNPTH